MITLSKNQIIHLHELLLAKTDGLGGLLDEGLLESALASPLHVFGGVDLYPSVAAKIARTCFGIIRNHPFVYGNKRIGTYAMLVYWS
jgi:death-on-curing protein